ncbi:MAG: hypothetical protein ACU0BO_10200 [Limimaricola soesokkakensis]|uniref:hypothetical protein n=1 Tax=Limimaricola soesokkakensis TaxID=1343159 RepID=UPI004059A93B
MASREARNRPPRLYGLLWRIFRVAGRWTTHGVLCAPYETLGPVQPLIQAIGGAIRAAYLQFVSAVGLILAHHALIEPIEASLIAPLPLLAMA